MEWVRRRLALVFQQRSSKSRVCTYARGTPTAKQLGECSSFHLSPPFQSLELNRKKERERERERERPVETKSGNSLEEGWREREAGKYPGEFISRRDYQTGADTRIPSSHNSRPSRRGCTLG